MKVNSLDGLAAVQRVLRERRRQAEEEAARRAAEEAARRREHELFERTVGPVVRLRPRNLAEIARPRPLPHPRQRELDEAEVMRTALSDEFDPESLMETDDQLSYRQSGIGDDVLKKLRRGVWVMQGQIDLHGLNRDAAREALAGFLIDAGKRGWRCVRVVHGKGLGSPGRQPVLKGKVRSWLVQRQEVLAFTQARGPDGGAGALIVLLDSSRSPDGRLR
ncbi:DNA-nicking endonuclease, Smr domain [Sphaerotilus natans]|nr:Smr/MutS family protein [Sphaerotilus natans]SIR90914.1 DNA-nicking endonuclease, Smr domain [Sphaerotilus natans]